MRTGLMAVAVMSLVIVPACFPMAGPKYGGSAFGVANDRLAKGEGLARQDWVPLRPVGFAGPARPLGGLLLLPFPAPELSFDTKSIEHDHGPQTASFAPSGIQLSRADLNAAPLAPPIIVAPSAIAKPVQQVKLVPNGPPAITSDQIIEKARALLGVPYVWGGNTVGGLDCSAYLSMVWGVSRQTTDTLHKVAYPIGKDELLPGDALNLTIRQDPRGYGHVRLFHAWATADRSIMWVYEETPPRSLHRMIPYDNSYTPMRRINYLPPNSVPLEIIPLYLPTRLVGTQIAQWKPKQSDLAPSSSAVSTSITDAVSSFGRDYGDETARPPTGYPTPQQIERETQRRQSAALPAQPAPPQFPSATPNPTRVPAPSIAPPTMTPPRITTPKPAAPPSATPAPNPANNPTVKKPIASPSPVLRAPAPSPTPATAPPKGVSPPPSNERKTSAPEPPGGRSNRPVESRPVESRPEQKPPKDVQEKEEKASASRDGGHGRSKGK